MKCLLVAGLAAWLTFGEAGAWEGFDWNEWREVTTWRKPSLQTRQSGQRELAPLLGGTATDQVAIGTVAEWEKRRAETAAAIQAILGDPGVLQVPAMDVSDLGVTDMGGYTRRHILIRSEADDWIPAYLLVPKKLRSARVPAMICLHQTVSQGKDEICGIEGDPEMAFATELVARGYICIAPDAIGFGERIPKGTDPYHGSMEFFRRHPAWSFMGKMIWDNHRVVDYLLTLPQVDPGRIGSIGHSHGGYGTLFAAAFDDRISAAIASCAFTTLRHDPHPERWSNLTALIPQLGCYLPDVGSIPFDWQDVCALIAPRSLFVSYAVRDRIFPETDNLGALFKDLRDVYALYGATGSLQWRSFDGPHKFPVAGREAAYQWLKTQWWQDGVK